MTKKRKRTSSWFKKRAVELQKRRDGLKELEEDLDKKDYKHQQRTKDLRDKISILSTKVRTAEEKLRDAMEKEFLENDNRAPGPGLEVRTRTVTSIEEDSVLQWCMKHKIFLLVDYKEVNRFAKAGLQIDGVELEEIPQTILSSNFHRVIEG